MRVGMARRRQSVVINPENLPHQAGETKEPSMNDAPFGALAPNPFERAIMALTVRMPSYRLPSTMDGGARM